MIEKKKKTQIVLYFFRGVKYEKTICENGAVC